MVMAERPELVYSGVYPMNMGLFPLKGQPNGLPGMIIYQLLQFVAELESSRESDPTARLTELGDQSGSR